MAKAQQKNQTDAQPTGVPLKRRQAQGPEQQPGAGTQEIQRALDDPQSADPDTLLHLQRTVGNRAVQRLLQRKLTVGAADDPYEREADRMAQHVMTMPAPAAQGDGQQSVQRVEDEELLQSKAIQRVEEEELLQGKAIQRVEDEELLQGKPIQRVEDEELLQGKPIQRVEDEELLQGKPIQRVEDEELLQGKAIQRVEDEELLQGKAIQRVEDEELLQGKADLQRSSADGFEAGADIEQRLNATRGGGSPLPSDTRAFMEPRFGADFSGVRIHTGSEAAGLSRSVQAQAFATGSDIYFDEGKYNPGTDSGKELLAHELTHTIQQGGSAMKTKRVWRKAAALGVTLSTSAPARVQRMLSVGEFKALTYEGVFAGRGSMLKEIEKLIDAYFGVDVTDPKDRLNKVLQIKKLTEMWIDEHTGDKSREKRMVGMQAFKGKLDSEVIPELETLIRQDAGDENFQTPAEYTGESAELKRLRTRHEGSASESVSYAGKLLDTLLPHNGDKGEVELELKVPVAPAAFVGGLLKIEGEREKGAAKVRAEVSLTGGVTIGVAELRAAVGGYFEAQAPTNADAMKLVSYGLYKRLTESPVVPADVASYFWGGSTGYGGRKRSDKWAAGVEESLLNGEDDNDTYVETGGLAGAKAELGVGAKVGAEARYSSGKRYSGASVTGAKAAGSADLGVNSKIVELKVEADASLLKGEASVKLKWLADAYAETELEFKGEIVAGSGTVVKRLGKVLQMFATSMREKSASAIKTADPNNRQTVGSVAEAANGLYNAGSGADGELATAVGTPEEAEGLSSSGSALLNVKGAKKTGEGWELEGSINTQEEASLNAGVLKGKAKKVQRIWGVKYAGDAWTTI